MYKNTFLILKYMSLCKNIARNHWYFALFCMFRYV